jgi:hypothetical protein
MYGRDELRFFPKHDQLAGLCVQKSFGTSYSSDSQRKAHAMRPSLQKLSASVVLILTALAGPSRAGDDVPYKGTINFAVTSMTPGSQSEQVVVNGSLDGNETHLGRFTGRCSITST